MEFPLAQDLNISVQHMHQLWRARRNISWLRETAGPKEKTGWNGMKK